MYVYSLVSVLTSSESHKIALADVAVLDHIEPAVRSQHYAGVHPALFGKSPLTAYLEVLRKHRSTVEVLRRYAVSVRSFESAVRSVSELCFREVRCLIFGNSEIHYASVCSVLSYLRKGRYNNGLDGMQSVLCLVEND